MKKNLLLFLSMLLILSMFMSMFYKAVFGKDDNALGSQNSQSVQQDLKINISTEPSTLHPGLASDTTSESVLLQSFEGLSRVNLWGETVNAAAEVVKISDDLKTYTFTLRDAKWTNGAPVIAKDFEYAWKWILDPSNQSDNADQLYFIEGAKSYHEGTGRINEVGVKALDDKRLEVKLVKPTSNFLELTASSPFFPINSKIAENNLDWAQEEGENYTSNGPFKLTEWSHGEKIVLKKNKNYWDSNIVKLKTITMLMVNDPKTELSMFEKGELDWASSLTGNLQADVILDLVNEDLKDVAVSKQGHVQFKWAYFE